MRAVVVTGGEVPPSGRAEGWVAGCSVVVAADSGLAALAAWGIEPTHIVGDMDSMPAALSSEDYPAATVRRYEQAKDHTDTELALHEARRAGADEIVILGGGGGRLDHLLSIVALFDRTECPTAWVTHREEVFLVEEELVLDTHEGETVSVFPVGIGPWRMSSTGLRWPLDELDWRRGDIGVSNAATGGRLHVRMERGRVIVVKPFDADDRGSS